MEFTGRSILTDSESECITNAVIDELSYIHWYWGQITKQEIGESVEAMYKHADRPKVPSRIPGYKTVDPSKPTVGQMIAVVTDMRNSSCHLSERSISFPKESDRLRRVHLETGALMAAAATVVSIKGGETAEFLGDGCLSFFDYTNDNYAEKIKDVYFCGRVIVNSILNIVNPLLGNFRIEPIHAGVGIAASKALITVVGVEGNYLPKVIGQCVFQATKCSSGFDAVALDQSAKLLFKSTQNGKLKFQKYTSQDDSGRVVYLEEGKGRLPFKQFKKRKST